MHILRFISGVACTAPICFGCSKSPSQSAGQQIPMRETSLDVRFLGVTNDAAGASLARFELRNIGSKPVDVSLPGFVDIGWRGGGYFSFSNAIVQTGAAVETWVPAPTNRVHWRAEFLCATPGSSTSRSIFSDYVPTKNSAPSD